MASRLVRSSLDRAVRVRALVGNIINYYSTNLRDAHIWSARTRYLSCVHDRYPAIYVGCKHSSEILQFSA